MRLELTTPAYLDAHTVYKYRALTDCATGADCSMKQNLVNNSNWTFLLKLLILYGDITAYHIISKMKHIGKDGKNDPLSEKKNNLVWCMIIEATQFYI